MSRLAVTAVTDDNLSMYFACLQHRHSSLVPSYACVRPRLLISYWGHEWHTARRMLTASPAFWGPMLFFHARAVTILLLRLALIQNKGRSLCLKSCAGMVHAHVAGPVVSATPPQARSVWQCQSVSGVDNEPLGQAPQDPSGASRVLHTTYGALDAPLLARLDLLFSRHLAASRPQDIVAAFANGKKRTYRRVIEPRKEDVSPRHARRRRAQAKEEVARIFHVDPGVASAVMDDVCRRARASGGVALAPIAAVSALSLRLQAQFMVDNNKRGATFQRFRRLLGPRECRLATAQQLRAGLRSASEKEKKKATRNGDEVYLISRRAAVEALIFDLHRQNQFIERGLRGADGRAVAATLPFVLQTSASALRSSAVKDVHICFGLDKGGSTSSCKAVLSCAN